MESDFWLSKWESNVIGFHLTAANPLLIDHISTLPLPEQGRVFLPLCGKSMDIQWLLQQGYAVVGCELSELAVKALFQQLELEPRITELARGLLYSAHQIDIYVHDIFELSAAMLGDIDAVYDRAAIIALPPEMRERYAPQLIQLTGSAPQLIVTLVYDQTQISGPPFCVADDQIKALYSDSYELDLLASAEVPGGLKGKCAALENVWLLS
ncbi:MAG: thiopurine S-methyltransferase [Halioglobus sp.]|jgi:thiopurine S-methyltransferase